MERAETDISRACLEARTYAGNWHLVFVDPRKRDDLSLDLICKCMLRLAASVPMCQKRDTESSHLSLRLTWRALRLRTEAACPTVIEPAMSCSTT